MSLHLQPKGVTMDETEREPVLVDLQGRRLPGPVNLDVPDRLMQEPWLRPEAISGTSANFAPLDIAG